MATREFPALGFNPAPGDPAVLDAAAEAGTGAGQVFGSAATNVDRLDSSGWFGDAADGFRGQLADLPRDLSRAERAYRTSARALSDYGTGLANRQRRAADLESRAAALRRQEATAVAEVNRLAGRTAPSGSAEFTALKGQYDSARSRATSLGSDLQEVLAEARRLHTEHRGAAGDAARKIRDAAEAPYEEPGWLSKAWSSVKGWISDNADVLAQISAVLKGVSAVLGVLSFVPGLQFLAPFALAAGGIALAIDVAVKLATGKGSWTAIGIDAALTFIPGGKILSGLKGVKAAVAGERAVVDGKRIAAGSTDASRVRTAAAGSRRPGTPVFGHADRDPLRRWGPARETHPAEWDESIAYAEDAGVRVIHDSGRMAYGPSPGPGRPGHLILDPDSSVGALRHEMQHLLDDRAAGWPGMRAWMEDPVQAFRMEERAYRREIEYARSIGDTDSERLLLEFIEQDRVRWLGEG